MELTTITNTGNWGQQASSLNENFQKIKVELLKADNTVSKGKGLFRTLETLKSAYPNPEKGWWAIVGNTLPGAIYVAQDGIWKATGEVGGAPSINIEPVKITTLLQSEYETLPTKEDDRYYFTFEEEFEEEEE